MTSPCIDNTIEYTTSCGTIVIQTLITSFEFEDFKLSSTFCHICAITCCSTILDNLVSYNQSFNPRAGSFDEIEFFWFSIIRYSNWSKTWVFIVIIADNVSIPISISFIGIECCSILSKTLRFCGGISP